VCARMSRRCASTSIALSAARRASAEALVDESGLSRLRNELCRRHRWQACDGPHLCLSLILVGLRRVPLLATCCCRRTRCRRRSRRSRASAR
jgi:hypothetical protein